MKKLTFFCGVLFLPFLTHAQTNGQNEKTSLTKLDSVVVQASRAGEKTPVAHSELTMKEMRSASPVQSLPMMLSLMPSVVSSTEGGNGLGYSSLRVRGSDGSRINVTLNGIALNDAESQEVFWVNIPSLTSILQDVQLQRGVGTSTNGPAAFGASINMRTLYSSPSPYGIAELGVASYNTYLSTIGAGSGILRNGLSFDILFSHNSGDGYIRNAMTDLNSLYASAAWLKRNSLLRFTYILGDHVSGLTWEGISREQMAIDRRFNPSGVYYDHVGNIHYYNNETDNYKQHHFQLSHSYNTKSGLVFNSTIHYTLGDGYYENYKASKKFSEYGLSNQTVDGVEYKRSDVIIRQAMKNASINLLSNMIYKGSNFSGTAGITYSYFDGDHFGRLIWSMYNAGIAPDYQWYLNTGYKNDYSVFAKGEYDFSDAFMAYADLQYRGVSYVIKGIDKDFADMDFDKRYSFFNPKVGVSYTPDKKNQFYLSLSVAHREPSRSDIKESIKSDMADRLLAERLFDYEAGYKFNAERVALSANIYLMEYKNQLVPTGKLSETGYVIKENVKSSYRRGVELAAAWEALKWLKLDGNLTLSSNKILNYTSWTDLFDSPEDWNPLPQRSSFYKITDISYSPSVTGMCKASILPGKGYLMELIGKYVGKQYYDNTSDDSRSVPSYYTATLHLGKSFHINTNTSLDLNFYVDNLFNKMYFSNAWVYMAEFADNSARYIEEGLYPQAGRNFTLKASFRF
ncbi:MAG: TonB-dependent receptor [Bacteroidales bacterium]|nr:TonB-dependent receptor [Bacteroidales bacterium]